MEESQPQIVKSNFQKLEEKDFLHLLSVAPLISIDLIIRNGQGEILLGKRKNNPAKGYWFVPGGRIFKNESITDAFKRISAMELGKALSIEDAICIGHYEHLYSVNALTGKRCGTHYVVLAYEMLLDINMSDLPVNQHEEYRFFGIEELMGDRNVHRYTKDYFRREIINKDPQVYNALVQHYIHYDSQMWGRIKILLAV